MAAAGVHIDADAIGHVWAFSPSSLIARPGDNLQPGDLAVRIDEGRQTSRYYEVMAFLPGRGDLAELVNGHPWKAGGEPYPNFVVFRPFQTFPRCDFEKLVEQLQVDRYVSGPRYEARFLPFDADALLHHIRRLRST